MANPKKDGFAGSVSETEGVALLQTGANGGTVSVEQFQQLISLMAAKEQRLMAKEQELAILQQIRDKQDKQSSDQIMFAKMLTQKNCKHLKGGKTRQRGQQKDPNVFAHTFTDGSVMIKCNTCRAKWFKEDTKEFLVRNGQKIENWTKIGWAEATELVEESSNKPSSSEIFPGDRIKLEAPVSDKGFVVPNVQI